MSLGRQLLRNIVTSWLSYGVRLVIGFFFVPYIAATLGGERYGLWTIAFQTINYFSLLDLGLERAVVRYVARFFGERNTNAISQVLSTSTVIYAAIAVVTGVATYLVSIFFFELVHVSDPSLVHEAQAAFQILGLFLIGRFLVNGFTQTLVGLQRLDVFNTFDILEEVLRISCLVFFLSRGYGLPWLAAGIFGVSLLRHFGVLIWLRWRFPEIRLGTDAVSAGRARELYSFSRISFGITLGWLVVFGSDSILLGILATPLAAGLYAPATQLMLYLRHIVNAIGTPLAPAISQLQAQSDMEKVGGTYLKGIKYVGYVSFFVSTGVVLYARPFVHLWLPAQFAETAGVMMILAVGSAFFLPQILGNAVLFGLQKHRYLLITLAAEAALKLLLALTLVPKYGSIGMAIATAAPQVLLYSAIYPTIVGRRLGLSSVQVLGQFLLGGAVALVVTAPTGWIARQFYAPTSWLRFSLDAGLVTILAAVVGYLFILQADDRLRLRQAVRL